MTDAKLKSLVERIERLMDERDGLGEDIRDVFTEVKSAGYVPKVLRKVIVRRRMDPAKRAEEDSWQEMYESALDGPTRKALALAASGATARQIEQETGIDQATVARSVSLKNRRETKPPHDPKTGEINEQPDNRGAEPRLLPEGGRRGSAGVGQEDADLSGVRGPVAAAERRDVPALPAPFGAVPVACPAVETQKARPVVGAGDTRPEGTSPDDLEIPPHLDRRRERALS